MYSSDAIAAHSGKMDFLSFQLGGLDYGVEFRKVKELRTLKSLERFASDGTLVKGVAVSRGVIMPLVDMRMAFSGRSAPPRGSTDVIVLQLANCVVGMVVDGVTDVVGMYPDQISQIPGAEGEGECDYLLGLGEAGGRRLILVDIDRLMSIRRDSPCAEQKVA
ncbi:chemotaxis protein CheW [Massilia sp. PAMC28688]|uniref:chemotaxis protein CheW n=1 Tax=Massilia sp. PAMC28688 TaxID=2861283 RepID=UPI001C62B327|nr:chemotaxis protein CheW [Massilia sp. PAMC28688]QYF92457.1 chemotaxis protein CheW [Massilia sp. PAMC28688]